MSKGRLIVFASPAGGGKTTVIRQLRERHPDWTFSVSATTRTPRPGEANGREYYFFSRDEFQDRLKRGDFLEHEEVHGNLYGTLKGPTQERLDRGETVIFDLDAKGAMSIKHFFPEAVTVFLLPLSLEILRERLLKRGTESPEIIEKRLSRASLELSFAPQFDVKVVNEDLARTVNEVDAAISACFS